MKKVLVVLVASLALLGASCGAKNADKGDALESGGPSTTQTTVPAATAGTQKFGDADSPCGKGKYTVQADQAGKGADKLHIGVANDRGSTIRPGLLKELYDAGVAFSDWCNAQGGIGGLPIDVVDLDGQLLQVEAAMTTACTDVFMMVGGGYAQDDLEFSGKDGSDFHKCKLADIPGFTVSVAKSESNGQVSPIPNPAFTVSTTWLQDFNKLYPKAGKKSIVVYGDLPSLRVNKEQYVAAAKAVGTDVVAEEPYPATGLSDWTPLAQKIIDSGAGSMYFVGEPTNLSSLLAKLKEQNWGGKSILQTNMYDPVLFSAGANVADGVVIRSSLHMLEESDKWPAIKQYQDNVKKYVPDGKIANLGVQATSAWMLFATAANDCAKKNNNVLERSCVLKSAAAISDWTGGGLNAPDDPAGAGGQPVTCNMLITVKNGKFERLYPKIGGEGDDKDGFHCPTSGATTKVTGDIGKGNVDPTSPS